MTDSQGPSGAVLFEMPDAAVGAKFTDTLDIDQAAHLLYMGDNWTGGVDVFDISTPAPVFLETVRIRGQLFGVCAAPSVGRVYAGLSGSRLAVIEAAGPQPRAHSVLALVDTGGRGNTDLIDFDPDHQKLYAANRNEGFVAVLDAKTNELCARIDGLGGALEQPRYNPADHMVYVAGNADNVLYQIDPHTDTLVNTFDIVDACHPNGMAINPDTNEALLACSNREHPHTVIWDLTEQKVASVVEECGCGDGAAYSPGVDRFFFAASGFPGGPVLGVFGGSPAKFLGNIPTMRGASWVGFDETNEIAYVPAITHGKPGLLGFPLPVAL